ncbi:MAG TPA: hypothetical protein VJ299_11110 [Steroidobacteraceae bacterium]|nr:hypothetical protein [Steroidobacteraceae bacterium]
MARTKKSAATDAAEAGAITRVEDLEKSPQGIVKRWLAELALADQGEDDWRKESDGLWQRYEAEKTRASSFNILWSNTEILSAAIYNSTPQPDVRRRFRDDDKVGKAVATILERSLAYEIDDYDFDDEVDAVVLDMLVCGRGLLRVKYEPKFVAVGADGAVQPAAPAGAYQEPPAQEDEPPADAMAQPADGAQAAPAAPHERVADQSVECCHVQWNDFRRGPGKRWRDVPWLAFRHEFTQEMSEEKFGKQIAARLTYSQAEGSEGAIPDRHVRNVFKVCEVWEIWDKDRKRVLFIAPSYKDAPCLNVPDPLELKGFWPMPRPAYAVRNSRSLVPIPLYRLYEEQAKELDSVSARINITVRALRLRGAYNAALTELGKVIEADDTDMIPVENASAVAESGGLDKNIWIMPIDKLIQVLRGLYEAREQIKQTIYEIVGIADILRGASDPNETAKAQQLKSNWGSIRVQKMQREIQRLARDVMRLKAEVIAQQFRPEKLAAITSVNLPTNEQRALAQQAAAQAQQQQQPPPPEVEQILGSPTWEEVVQVLRSDDMRCYRVDVETDSTVAETLNRDMTGLGELLAALSGWIQGAFTAVQQGAMTVDTMKQIALAVIRRARLGSAVEDAFEQLQAPPPAAPDQGEQLDAMKQQLLEIIKGEGARLSQTEAGIADREQQLADTVGQIHQGAAALGQGAQATAAQAIEQQQTSRFERQVLGELAAVLQQLGAADQGTRGQVQTAMTQVAGAVQGVMQALAQVTAGLQQVEAALKAPKKVSFTRGTDNRINGATASI